MRPITFKTKIWIYVGAFTAVILTIAFAILALVYYWVSIHSFQKELVFSTREIITNLFVFENNQILFKKDSQGRTLSAYLRDENLSALIMDANLKPFASYGIYQTLGGNTIINENIDMKIIKEVFQKNKPDFSTEKLDQKEVYFVLTTPVLFQGNKIGLLQIAALQPLFSEIKGVGLYMLFGVVLLSFIISWPLSHVLINFLFKPLEDISKAMEKARISNLNVPLQYNGNPTDEIAILVKTYNNLLSRLAEGFEKQKSFISNASHELKSPLSRAISSLDVMLLDVEDGIIDTLPKNVRDIRNDLFGFSRMIDDLLLLSRIDTGAVALQIQTINLREFLSEIYALFRIDIEEKNLTIKENFNGRNEIRADKAYLKLILINLLSNAIKYSFKGDSIEVFFEIKENIQLIMIRDFGQGMNANDYEHVFDRFYRSAKIKASGFGVGMSLVKQLCEIHKIKIEYDKTITPGVLVKMEISCK